MLRYVLWVIRSVRKDLGLRNYYGIGQKTLVQFREAISELWRLLGPGKAALKQVSFSSPIPPRLAELVAAAANRSAVGLKVIDAPGQALMVTHWHWKLPHALRLSRVQTVEVAETLTGYQVRFSTQLRFRDRPLQTKHAISAFWLPTKARVKQLEFQKQGLLLRELARLGLLDFAHYLQHFQQAVTDAGVPVVIYLPELGLRNPQLGELGFVGFPAITNVQGWIGCARSQSSLAQLALNQGLASLTVIEDDAELETDWKKRWNVARKLVESGELDVASGLVSDLQQLPDTWKLIKRAGVNFFVSPIFSSNVFTVLGPQVLAWITNFPSGAKDPNTEAIDCFIESKPGLRNGVLVPPLVKHSDQASSTLWGFRNRTYAQQMSAAQKLLADATASAQQNPPGGKLIK